MSGLPPYHSSPEAKEIWEITGALAEEQRLRDGHLYCSECRHGDDPDRPYSCSKLCPNRKSELFWIMLDMEENWFWFWYHVEAEHSDEKCPRCGSGLVKNTWDFRWAYSCAKLCGYHQGLPLRVSINNQEKR